jgi:hypothetical protein
MNTIDDVMVYYESLIEVKKEEHGWTDDQLCENLASYWGVKENIVKIWMRRMKTTDAWEDMKNNEMTGLKAQMMSDYLTLLGCDSDEIKTLDAKLKDINKELSVYKSSIQESDIQGSDMPGLY